MRGELSRPRKAEELSSSHAQEGGSTLGIDIMLELGMLFH